MASFLGKATAFPPHLFVSISDRTYKIKQELCVLFNFKDIHIGEYLF